VGIGDTITLEALERDPYPIYARLRDEEPVSWVPAVQLWLVTRHDDVRAVDLDPETFTAATDPSTLNRTMGANMLGSEGPHQRWVRAVVEPPFRPRDVEERTQGMIPGLAHELIDSFVALGEVDLLTAFADPMSVRSVRFMLGLDDVPWEDLLRWNQGLMPGLANFEGDARKQVPADRASAELGQAIHLVLDRLEREPDGSVLSWMVHHEEQGRRMSREEIVANTKLMLSGGLQEPRDLIALALWALGTDPGQLEEVRADRSLVKAAVEETLRWGARGHVHATDHPRGRARGRRDARGRPGRCRPVLGEPRPAAVDRSRPVRHPSEGGRASGLRDRDALLSGRVVRATPGACLARDPAGPVARPSPGPRPPGSVVRLGVPRPPVHVDPVGDGMRVPARAETVGSLLRPPRLRAAIDAFYEAGHSAALDEDRAKDRAALRRLEDEAIRDVVRRQIDAGLDVVTDGEFRRWMFLNSFYDAVEGVRTGKTVRFRDDRGGRSSSGSTRSWAGCAGSTRPRPGRRPSSRICWGPTRSR